MKTNKLLILALPLLLAISACSNSGSKSNQSSQDTSSEEPAPSRSEEPLPDVDPAEQEATAEDAFRNVSNMLKVGDYIVEGETAEFDDEVPLIVVADGYYSKTVVAQLDDGTTKSLQTVGYLANAHGVLRARSQWSGSFATPSGYALKTDNYQEAKEIVNSLQKRLVLDSDKWEYTPNTVGNPIFKTTDEGTLNDICDYMYGSVIPGKFTIAYAAVALDGESVKISTEASLPGRHNYFTARRMDLNKYRSVTRESDSSDWRAREVAEIISYWKDYEVSDTEWYSFNYSSEACNYLPFPSQGNRYYFFDRYTDNIEMFENSTRYIHIGFIDTGDISESYKTQLLNNNWSLDAGETNKFTNDYQSNAHVTVRYVAAADCDRPDLYTKGIFYLDFTYTY